MILHPEPSALEQSIRRALRHDQRCSSQPVDVEVRPEGITLRGFVQSFRRKLAIHEVVQSEAGGRPVDNRLRVHAQTPQTDAEVAANVRSLLDMHPKLLKQAILVEVRGGRVRLSGAVNHAEERHLAEDVALLATGAKGVVNELVVEPEARSQDLAIARELEHELAQAPGLADAELKVALSGNLLVLSGTVRSAAQLRNAITRVRAVWVGDLQCQARVPDSN